MEKIKYDYLKRQDELTYLIHHVKVLLNEAIENKTVSFVLYACLESRNILEKIEFDLILMSTDKSEWETIEAMAKGKSGINKTNREYKSLLYRYQTFSEAISRVSKIPVKAFDYRTSGQLQKDLSEYLHIYTKVPSDMGYEGEFIQRGLRKAKETIVFVENFFVKNESDLTFGCLRFDTLSGSFKKEFERWKSCVSEDTESLYLKLKDINDREFGGAKASEKK